jgi:hypothetical protein
LAGRPVLMVGTLAMAFLKAVSAMPARACKPARISSLFLTSTPKVMARFFIASICSNSVLGSVKLSRTTLTFLSLAGLAGAAGFFLLAVLGGVALGAGSLASTALDLADAALVGAGALGFEGAAVGLALATGAALLTGLLATGALLGALARGFLGAFVGAFLAAASGVLTAVLSAGAAVLAVLAVSVVRFMVCSNLKTVHTVYTVIFKLTTACP